MEMRVDFDHPILKWLIRCAKAGDLKMYRVRLRRVLEKKGKEAADLYIPSSGDVKVCTGLFEK